MANSSSAAISQENVKNSVYDRDKLSGRIDFKCEKFAELANSDKFMKFSEQKLCIRGLIWRILIQKNEEITKNSLGIFIHCQKHGEDRGWSCAASVELSLHSQKEGGQNIVKNYDNIFHPGIQVQGFGYREFLEIEKVLDPANGWMDKVGALHVSAEIKADEPQGLNYIRRPDVLLVNEKEMRINKFHLALKSDYFGRFFFGEDAKKNTGIELEPPATVEHFKRMLDAMEPENRPLDDKCIEGVLKLANRFLLGEVEGKCRTFLARCCHRSVMFKYRLADKYNFVMLKQQILDSSRKEEFTNDADFKENLEEYAKLDEKARKELGPRIDLVFGNNKNVVAK